jgi:hypothetical protein
MQFTISKINNEPSSSHPNLRFLNLAELKNRSPLFGRKYSHKLTNMKRILLKSLGAIGFAFVVLVLYANFRSLTPTEQNNPIHLKIFSIVQPMDEQQSRSIKAALQLPGITASCVNTPHQTVSVTYRPDEITMPEIMAAISLQGNLEVSEKQFPPAPVCPVPPLQALKSHVLKSLRFF